MRPKATEIEQSALGLALRDGQACSVVCSRLTAEDFTGRQQLVFSILQGLFTEGSPTTAAGLRNKIIENNLVDELGGKGIAQDLLDASQGAKPSGIGIACDYLQKYTRRREFLNLWTEYHQRAKDPAEDVDDLFADAGTDLFNVLSDKDSNTETDHTEAATATLKEIQNPQQRGLETGLDLDKITMGFKPKQFVVIAGKTSHGKSALAQNLMLHSAQHGGHVGFVSMEMSRSEIMERVYSNFADINLTKISQRNLSEEDIQRIKAKEQEIKAFEHGFTIIDSGSMEINKLYATARRLKMQKNTKMLIVDYLQQVWAEGGTREQEVAKVSKTLKRIAMDLDMVVIGLSQFNRKATHTQRPQLNQLRESGAIAQDANSVILLWNPSADNVEYFPQEDTEGKWAGQSTRNIIELHVAKNRGGKTGTVKIGFDGSHQRFHNLAQPKKSAMDYL